MIRDYFVNKMVEQLKNGDVKMAGIVHDAWANADLADCVEGPTDVQRIVGDDVSERYEDYIISGAE